MDFSPQFLIDFSINFGGYVLAAILGGLLYRIVRSQPAPATAYQTETTPAEPTIEMKKESDPIQKPEPQTKMDFINFVQSKPKTEKPTVADIVESPPEKNPNRNRKEILQLASKMIQSNFTNDRIKELLPVSDGELALISMSKK